jgi:hypothetical protein
MIGIFGTSDVENYGDLVYPPIFDHLLQRSGLSVPTRAFAFLHGPAPAGAGYISHSISSLLHSPERLVDALCIGGGDIIRTDFRAVATHYAPQFIRMSKYPAYWWLVRRVWGKQALAKEFVSRFMDFECAGPLLLNATEHINASPIAYWSCGVPFEFKPADQIAVKAALDNAAFISVRDLASAAKLHRAGVKGPVHVAPDAVVTISDKYDIKNLKAAGIQLFADNGIDVTRRILGFQAVALKGEAVAEVASQLLRHIQATGDEVALIPIGHCHKDQDSLVKLARACRGGAKLVSVREVDEIMAGIVACDTFVGTSLHGNITAFSFGIPHLVGPRPVDKLHGFVDVVGLDAEARLTNWSQLHERLRWLRSQPDGFLSARVERAKAAVYRTFGDMLAHLKLPAYQS